MLVGVSSRALPRSVVEEHLDELERLVDSAGGRVVGRVVQERSAPDPATYVGRGAVEAISEKARENDAALVVFDDELTPGQVRNLEKLWGEEITALDRPGLILDVFASHARTREARTQVDLAQLQYLLPRLAGRYGHLSGLAGGIGGRGAGEQKLELDRRKIRDRITRLRRDLEKIETSRQVRRRSRASRVQVAIAGYTNAGKTTLFNRLTRESAYAADRLFATLDSKSARGASARLSGLVFVDTVGFVRKLRPPWSLRSAPRSRRSATPTSCCTCSTPLRRASTRNAAWRSTCSRIWVSSRKGSFPSGTRPTCRERGLPAARPASRLRPEEEWKRSSA